MHRRTNRALAATALGLAGLVAWESLRADLPAPAPPVAAARLPVAAAPAPQPEALAAAAGARPLFTPGRRPATAAPPPTEAASMPRLAGVTAGSGTPTAFLVRPGGDTVALAPGGRLGRLLVRAVQADSVVLEGPDGVRVLALAGDAAPGTPARALVPDAPAPGLPPGELRAVLASAEATALAGPGPQGCCVSDLGWWRARPGAPQAGAPRAGASP